MKEIGVADTERSVGMSNPSGSGAVTFRATQKAETKRLSINLPKKTLEEMEAMADESGRTMTDFVRLALELVKVALDAEKHGWKLAIADPDGNLRKEIVLVR